MRTLTFRELVLMSVFWFALNFHWGALLTVAIPAEVLRFVPDAYKGRALSTVFASGAFVAMVTLPLIGALSDRATFRMGRRRPFVLAGALLNSFVLLGLAYAPSLALFTATYLLVQFSNNVAGAAYQGFIPDLVPKEQRGTASGLMGLMTMLGTIIAAVLAGFLMQRGLNLVLYVAIASVMVVCMVLTVWGVRETPLQRAEPFHLTRFLRSFYVSPRLYPDFAWLFLSRALVMMGFYTLLNFLQFFLKDAIGLPNFQEATGIVSAAVIVGAMISSFWAGWLSDRVGRRGIVSLSSLVMGLTPLVFLARPSFQVILLFAVVFGLGYGAFISVDWALATDVLPSAAAAAKDLGIWGIAVTLPQVLAPVIGGPIVDRFNLVAPALGYIALFTITTAYFAGGAATVWKIRGAR